MTATVGRVPENDKGAPLEGSSATMRFWVLLPTLVNGPPANSRVPLESNTRSRTWLLAFGFQPSRLPDPAATAASRLRGVPLTFTNVPPR